GSGLWRNLRPATRTARHDDGVTSGVGPGTSPTAGRRCPGWSVGRPGGVAEVIEHTNRPTLTAYEVEHTATDATVDTARRSGLVQVPETGRGRARPNRP